MRLRVVVHTLTVNAMFSAPGRDIDARMATFGLLQVCCRVHFPCKPRACLASAVALRPLLLPLGVPRATGVMFSAPMEPACDDIKDHLSLAERGL